MPRRRRHGLRALSLFSGGGGLDLGFERAGFDHVASFDVLEICGATLRRSRPDWRVFRGSAGDVNRVDWSRFAGAADVVHGGPPVPAVLDRGKTKRGKGPSGHVAGVHLRRPRHRAPPRSWPRTCPGCSIRSSAGTWKKSSLRRWRPDITWCSSSSRPRTSASRRSARGLFSQVFDPLKRPVATTFHHRRTAIVTICSHARRAPWARESGAGAAGHRVRLLCADPAVRFHGAQKIHERPEQQGQPGGMAAASDLAERSSEESKSGCDVPSGEWSLQDCRCRIAPCCRGSPTTGFLKDPRIRYSGRLETRCARPWGMRSQRP